MIGDTITITINAVAKTLSKINQDSYSSEYFLKEALHELRLKIRHTKDKVSAGKVARDRHTVTLTETIYPTATNLNSVVRVCQTTIVGDYNDIATDQGKNVVGMNAWETQANVEKLINWES